MHISLSGLCLRLRVSVFSLDWVAVFPSEPVSFGVDCMKNLRLSKLSLALAAVMASGAAFATDPYSTIAAGVSWTTVGTDAALIGVALAGVFIILRGIRMLVAFVRR
jgi:hypothetical protein